MRTDILQITDMVNTKLGGMFELIKQWGPTNNTIKSTLLKDIQHIQHELTILNINEKERTKNTRNMEQKCRNGDSCWYLKQGRCWFVHDSNGRNCNAIAHKQQSRASVTNPNSNNNTISNSKRLKKSPNTKQSKKAKKKKEKTHNTSDGSNNMNRKKKQLKKRRRKKKKRIINASSQDNQERNNSETIDNCDVIYPIAEPSPETNGSDIGNFKYSQTSNEKIGESLVPCLYKFDTMNSIESIINEQELLNKMNFITNNTDKLFALVQIRNLCDCAVECEWTLEETMEQINEKISDLKMFYM